MIILLKLSLCSCLAHFHICTLPLPGTSRCVTLPLFCISDDDVDLEALVNDMNSSFESLYSTCSMQSETAPLLQNGQLNRSQLPSSGSGPLQPTSPRQRVQRSQPVRIMAVR